MELVITIINYVGVLEHPNGETYEGIWKDDVRIAEGRTYYPNGDAYEGTLINGKRNGKGKILYNNRNYALCKWRYIRRRMEG